jgi:hypothetical protein
VIALYFNYIYQFYRGSRRKFVSVTLLCSGFRRDMCAEPVNYLRIELTAPTTAATGLSAGTKEAATGRTWLAIGSVFFTRGKIFLVRKFFWSGEAAVEKVRGVFISKSCYTICVYNNFIFIIFVCVKNGDDDDVQSSAWKKLKYKFWFILNNIESINQSINQSINGKQLYDAGFQRKQLQERYQTSYG